eukprot:13883569-Ditylum_brightwellii.AAC.1
MLLQIQNEFTTSITHSVISSVTTIIDNNLKAILGATLGNTTQGESSPQKNALGIGHVEQSSTTDAIQK